jgi:hypothetical protein
MNSQKLFDREREDERDWAILWMRSAIDWTGKNAV